MSIIVENVNVPRTGERLLLVVMPSREAHYVYTAYNNDSDKVAIINNTRVRQIPMKHGDIIDRDDIEIKRWDIDTELADSVRDATVILEAERE